MSTVVVVDLGWRLIAGMDSSPISNVASSGERCLARAKVAWRQAAQVVSLRWDAFLRSEAPTRSFAFRSYLATLDAEEVAAAEMSRLVTGTARSMVAA